MSVKELWNQVSRNWRDWKWWYFQFTNHVLPVYFKFSKNNGKYIAEEKWDNLVILDACRYDAFEKRYKQFGLKGTLIKFTSRASSTPEFLSENFKGKYNNDIIYVTANPYVRVILGKNNTFFKVVNVWIDDWDTKNDTVLPATMINRSLEIRNKYPDKRIVFHFVQPHCPFVGEIKDSRNFWQIALTDRNLAIRAYESNLDFVLSHLKKFVEQLPGKTVITADHGESYGEKATLFRIPIYGHPNGVHIPALIEVPWLEIEK